MKILTISGSSRSQSANTRLLSAIPALFPTHTFRHYTQINQLPLFKAESDKHPWDTEVIAWRQAVQTI